MKRYIITTPYCKGHVSAVYDETGLLCHLDASKLIAESVMHVSVLAHIPICEWQLDLQAEKSGLSIHEIQLNP